jgi:hypothetical protein
LCWPAVFDLAILLPMHDASSGPMLRAGFSAGDDRNDQPYFYVALHDATAGATPWPDAVLAAASLLQERRPDETAPGSCLRGNWRHADDRCEIALTAGP